MKDKSYLGLGSAIYMSLAYVTGIVIFLFILRYPEITQAAEKVQIVTGMKGMIFITNLLMYVLFGPVLVLFIIGIKPIFENKRAIVKFSSVIGFIWAGSLTASGMIANGAIKPISDLYVKDPEMAILLWQIIDTVSISIGNGNGEILGGLMTLGFSIGLIQTSKKLKALGVYGMIVGAIGIASLIPILNNFTGLFGILQLIWFILIGFQSLRKNEIIYKL